MNALNRTFLNQLTPPAKQQLPTVVIGAGPVGLAAAAHLVSRGHQPIILEAGASVGANMRSWGHVRMFSPWKYNIDTAARNLLLAARWTPPTDEEDFPTGNELLDGYLEPLSRIPEIKSGLRLKTRVVAVTRLGGDKMKTADRAARPFVVRVQGPSGDERLLAAAVIDASGTYHSPNPLGADGLPAIGERAVAHRVAYGIPDILGERRETYADKHVLVVGSGHSAFNALLDLEALSWKAPATRITWAIRRDAPEFGGGGRDELAARGALGQAVQRLLDTARITTRARDQAAADLPRPRDCVRLRRIRDDRDGRQWPAVAGRPVHPGRDRIDRVRIARAVSGLRSLVVHATRRTPRASRWLPSVRAGGRGCAGAARGAAAHLARDLRRAVRRWRRPAHHDARRGRRRATRTRARSDAARRLQLHCEHRSRLRARRLELDLLRRWLQLGATRVRNDGAARGRPRVACDLLCVPRAAARDMRFLAPERGSLVREVSPITRRSRPGCTSGSCRS